MNLVVKITETTLQKRHELKKYNSEFYIYQKTKKEAAKWQPLEFILEVFYLLNFNKLNYFNFIIKSDFYKVNSGY